MRLMNPNHTGTEGLTIKLNVRATTQVSNKPDAFRLQLSAMQSFFKHATRYVHPNFI